MAKYVILGSSGFFGSEFAKQIKARGSNCLLLGRNSITVFDGKDEFTENRKHSHVWEEIRFYLNNNSVIINCMWSKINHTLENSHSHLNSAESEISLIENLKHLHVKYVSFGSIKEFESENYYSSAKKKVYSKVLSELQNCYWFRIANCYGTTNSGRFIDHMFQSYLDDKLFKVNYPDKIINLYPIENLVSLCLASLSDLKSGTYNVASPQWAKLMDIEIAFRTLEEPKYFEPKTGPFSFDDPNLLKVTAPPLVSYFKYLKSLKTQK